MGFGPPVPFADKSVLGFNFVFLGSSTGIAFDLWLDQVELFN